MTETAPNRNHNQIIYSISEVSQAVKRMVEDHFGAVRLRGEISGYKLHSSGHAYFTLKDAGAVIDAVCWRGSVSKMKFKVEDGLEVVAHGKLTTYPGRSKYQIVVDFMEPAGAGALMALLEKRRTQFEEEGLFAAARKKKLPFMPRVIGVVTSPTGAVIRDILHRIADRFPCHVIVWPVAVQGEGSAEQIAAAMHGFNALGPASHIPKPDLLIVARGGGSLEDLWAFNEEIVVRAAADSQIPLISAVGHETDTTLIDYVSDMRAPTPTAAAEMAVPVLSDLKLALAQLEARIENGLRRQYSERENRLEGLLRGLPKPSQLLQVATQRLDDWSERLQQSLPVLLLHKEQKLAIATQGLRLHLLQKEIAHQSTKVMDCGRRSNITLTNMLRMHEDKILSLASRLENMNVQRVLERGFALVRGDDGMLVTEAQKARNHASLTLTFADGALEVKV